MSIYRGTTPSLKIKVTGIPVTDLNTIYITINQFDENLIEKTTEDIAIDSENNTLTISLSQEETLKFNPGKILIQLRAVTISGKAIATSMDSCSIKRILKDGVIV